jgi:hypothetical protein
MGRAKEIQKVKSPTKPLRQPGSMKGLIKILPGFYKADKEIEALFYGEPRPAGIDPSPRRK